MIWSTTRWVFRGQIWSSASTCRPSLRICCGKSAIRRALGDADIHEHAEQYLARCRETARQAAKHYGWTLISCVKDGRLRSIEDIHEEIYRHIAACLEE